MLCGEAPLYSKNKVEMLKNRLEKTISKRNEFSENAYNLLLKLLEKDVNILKTKVISHKCELGLRGVRR